MSRYWKEFEELKTDDGGTPRPSPGMPSMKISKGKEKTLAWPRLPGKTGSSMNTVKAPKVKIFVKEDY